MTAADVTATRKCYVLPCVVCLDLYPARRADSLTCSTGCRVGRHRGATDHYADAADRTAEMFGGTAAHWSLMARALDAVRYLRPDLLDCIEDISDVR